MKLPNSSSAGGLGKPTDDADSICLYCRRPTRKLETGAKQASQLILPKQYSHDLGVIVSRLLEENVSGYLLLSVCTQMSYHLV
jgi:hypothetical protein